MFLSFFDRVVIRLALIKSDLQWARPGKISWRLHSTLRPSDLIFSGFLFLSLVHSVDNRGGQVNYILFTINSTCIYVELIGKLLSIIIRRIALNAVNAFPNIISVAHIYIRYVSTCFVPTIVGILEQQ